MELPGCMTWLMVGDLSSGPRRSRLAADACAYGFGGRSVAPRAGSAVILPSARRVSVLLAPF